jgi:hypothetical protein
MNDQTPQSNPDDAAIAEIFQIARAMTASLAHQLDPFSDGTIWLSDDGADDLDMTRTILDTLIEALLSDDGNAACTLLLRSFRTNDPTILDEAPLIFTPTALTTWQSQVSDPLSINPELLD